MVKNKVRTDRERREFLKKLSAAGFVIGAGGALPLLDRSAGALAAPAPKVLAAVEGPDPANLARAAVEKLGGMSKFVKPGFTVVMG